MQGAGEGFGNIVAPLGHHSLLQPLQIILFLDDSFNFRERLRHRVGPSPAKPSGEQHSGKMAAWVFSELTQLSSEFFAVASLALGPTHPRFGLFLTGNSTLDGAGTSSPITTGLVVRFETFAVKGLMFVLPMATLMPTVTLLGIAQDGGRPHPVASVRVVRALVRKRPAPRQFGHR